MAALRGSYLGGLALGGLACAFLSTSVFAATPPSGVAIAVVQQAEANGGAGNRVLQQNGPVYSGDAIVTGPIGQAQVKFRDNTKLVVGPNSRLVIDAFIFSGNTARKLSINALKGAFRFISGNSRHDAYEIKTPTATIGVRGTQIDVSVTAGVVIYSGAADVCKRGGNSHECVTIQGGCSLATFGANQAPRKVNSIADRNQLLIQNFKYAVNQRGLWPEFRANTGSCGVLRATVIVPRDPSPPVIKPPVIKPPPPPPPPKCDYRKPHHPFDRKDHDKFKERHWPDHEDKKLHRRSWHKDGPDKSWNKDPGKHWPKGPKIPKVIGPPHFDGPNKPHELYDNKKFGDKNHRNGDSQFGDKKHRNGDSQFGDKKHRNNHGEFGKKSFGPTFSG